MVVHNFNRTWSDVSPNKTDAVSLVNPDTMLIFLIPLESLQAVTGRGPQFIERNDGVKLVELSSSDSPQRLRTPSTSSLRVLTVKNVLSSCILERPNHNSPVLHSRHPGTPLPITPLKVSLLSVAAMLTSARGQSQRAERAEHPSPSQPGGSAPGDPARVQRHPREDHSLEKTVSSGGTRPQPQP